VREAKISDRGSENYEKQILKIVSGVGSELVIEHPVSTLD
jgi:hypothetical protein